MDQLEWSRAKIYEEMRASFEALASIGIVPSVLDDFESFLTAPGTLSRPSLIVRCQINEREYRVRSVVDKRISRWRVSECFLPFLDRVIPRTRGRSDFFVLISDKLYVTNTARAECLAYLRRVPFLRCDRSTTDPLSMRCILIPDHFMLSPLYDDELRSIGKAVDATPFERRSDVIMWRGSFTGEKYPDLANYRRFPRYRLVRLSLEHPDVLDARLTNYDFRNNQAGPDLSRRLEEEFGPPAEWLPPAEFVAYRHLVSLDGVGAAWKRVATVLASGSVLLLHHRWKEFFYGGLKPWVHYVPVEYDLSDLIERHGWLVEHPFEAKGIAENGLRFARAILSPVALQDYVAAIIDRCAELYGP